MIASLVAALALISTDPSATFAWAPPSVGVPDHYLVLYSQEGHESEILVTTQPSITVAPTPGREINIRVAACADGLCSDWSRVSQSFSLNRSADFTQDGVVGLTDFSLLARDVGATSPYDLTGDGIVGLLDVSTWFAWIGVCIGTVYIDGAPADAYLPCDLLGQ